MSRVDAVVSWTSPRFKPVYLIPAILLVLWLLRSELLNLLEWSAHVLGNVVYAVISLHFLSGFSGFHYMTEPFVWPEITSYFGVHVRLVAEAIAMSVAIAVPIGVMLQRAKWLYLPVFAILDGIYAIPSLAFFALLLPFTGISDETVLIPLVAYTQFILVRNVIVGLDGVPQEAKEAARGMGMNPLQILFKVELPLALPVIVAGVRIATVAAIGMAAIAAFVAVQDLGRLFADATTNGGANAFPSIYAGAVAVVVLALVADLILRFVEFLIPANRVARAGKTSTAGAIARRLFVSRAGAAAEPASRAGLG